MWSGVRHHVTWVIVQKDDTVLQFKHSTHLGQIKWAPWLKCQRGSAEGIEKQADDRNKKSTEGKNYNGASFRTVLGKGQTQSNYPNMATFWCVWGNVGGGSGAISGTRLNRDGLILWDISAKVKKPPKKKKHTHLKLFQNYTLLYVTLIMQLCKDKWLICCKSNKKIHYCCQIYRKTIYCRIYTLAEYHIWAIYQANIF